VDKPLQVGRTTTACIDTTSRNIYETAGGYQLTAAGCGRFRSATQRNSLAVTWSHSHYLVRHHLVRHHNDER